MRISPVVAIVLGALSLGLADCAAAPEDPTAAAFSVPKPPGFSIDSPIRDLLNNPATLAVLKKDIPGMVDDPQLDMVESMSLRQMSQFPQAGLDAAKLQSIQVDLKAATVATKTEADASRSPK